METPFIELQGITKRFGSVIANHNVHMGVRASEVHAILGENGSGKSTLMNMLSGIYTPDQGQILKNGIPLHIQNPEDAIKAEIGMVHQHFKLVDVLSVKENIVLGQKDGMFIKGKELSKKIIALGARYGLSVDPDRKVYSLSISEKQTVEILKVLYRGARLLILDEPTAVLTPQEIKNLFHILDNMRKEGCSIILITHKMNEVMDISDRVTVMRKGESIATVDTASATPDELIEMMVGRPIVLDIFRWPIKPEHVRPLLHVDNLTIKNRMGRKTLRKVSFTLSAGEILGVAGIAGSGQKELCESIAGLIRADKGSIKLNEEELVGLKPNEIQKRGVRMSFIPEDRLGMGLVANMSIVDNVLLRNYHNSAGIILGKTYARKLSAEIISKYDIQTPSMNHSVKKLSGGNIQKVLLGRELDLNPQLLVTAYPVRGLDIGASYQIYDALNEQKDNGIGVLFIGEDLDVLLALCDRIMVLCEGKVTGIVDAATTTKEEVGMMMLGQTQDQGGAEDVVNR